MWNKCIELWELDLGTKHPKGVEGYRAIATFEAKASLEDQPEDGAEEGTAPKFVVDFKDVVVVGEATAENAYFEAQLEPKGDSRLVLEWTLNGKPLQESKLKIFSSIKFKVKFYN